MATVHLKHTDPTVREIIQATFPGFNGRDIVARIQETVNLHGTMWSDGNKRDYSLLSLSTMKTVPIPDEPFNQRSELHERTIKMEPGLVVVCHVRSGKREYLEIISSADNVTPLLPAPLELTADERTALIATRSLKSSYGGVKDYRFQEAKAARGITRDRWDAAIQSLKDKKLLDSRGAITVDGRNAAGSEQL